MILLPRTLNSKTLDLLLPVKSEASFSAVHPRFGATSESSRHEALEKCRRENPCSGDRLQIVERFVPGVRELEEAK